MQNYKLNDRKKGSVLSGIVGGAFSLTLSTIVVKILGLIYKIPLASILCDEGMGYFNSAYTVYAFFYLLCTAGVPKAVMILVSEAKAKEQAELENKIVRVALTLFLSLGCIITVLFIIFAPNLARLIGNSLSAATMVAIAPSIIFISLAGVVRGYLSAQMKLLDIAVSQIIEGVGRLVLGLMFAIIAVKQNMPLYLVSAFTIFGVTIGAFGGLLYLLICSKIEISNKKAGQNIKIEKSLKLIKQIFSISLPITLSAAIMSITNIIDLGLIMRSLISVGYSESEAGALYGNYTTLAVPMFNLAIAIITPISIAHLPALTKSHVTSDNDGMSLAQKSAFEMTALLQAPMMIVMIFFSKEILDMLFTNSETEIGSALLCVISPAILFSSLLLTVNTTLEARGKVRAPLISMLFGGLAKICVSFLIITRTELGILGAPIGTVISYAVALFTSIIIYTVCFKTQIPLLNSCLAPHLNAFISVGVARLLYDRLIRLSPTPALLFSIVIAAVIYLALSWVTGSFRFEKITKLSNYTNLS